MKIRADFVTNSSSTAYISIAVGMLDGSTISLSWVEGEDGDLYDCGERIPYGDKRYKKLFDTFEEFCWAGNPRGLGCPDDGAHLFDSLGIPDCVKESNFGRSLRAAKKEDLVTLVTSFALSGDVHIREEKEYYDLIEGDDSRYSPSYASRQSNDIDLLRDMLGKERGIPVGKAKKGDFFGVNIDKGQVVLCDSSGKKICAVNKTKTLSNELKRIPDGFVEKIVAEVGGTEKKPTVSMSINLEPELNRTSDELRLRCRKAALGLKNIDVIRDLEKDAEAIDSCEAESLLWYALSSENAAEIVAEIYRIFGNVGSYGGKIASKALKLGKVDCVKMILERDQMIDHPQDFDSGAIEAALEVAESGIKLRCRSGNPFNVMASNCALAGNNDLFERLMNAGVIDKAPIEGFWNFKDATRCLNAIFEKYSDEHVTLTNALKCSDDDAKALALKHVQYNKLKKAQLSNALVAIASCSCVQELERFFAEVKGVEEIGFSAAVSAAQQAGKTENVAWLLERDKATELLPEDDLLGPDDEVVEASASIGKDEREALTRGAIVSLTNCASLSEELAQKVISDLGSLENDISALSGIEYCTVSSARRIFVGFSDSGGIDSLFEFFDKFATDNPEIEISGWAEYCDDGVAPGVTGNEVKCDFWSIAGLKGLGSKVTRVSPGSSHPVTRNKVNVSSECRKQGDELFDAIVETGPVVCKIKGKTPKTVVLEEGDKLILTVNIDGRDTEAEDNSVVFDIKVKSSANKSLGSLAVDTMTAKSIAINIGRFEAFVAKVSPLVVAVDAIPGGCYADIGDIAFAFKKKNPFTSSERYSTMKSYFARNKERAAMFEDAMARFDASSES